MKAVSATTSRILAITGFIFVLTWTTGCGTAPPDRELDPVEPGQQQDGDQSSRRAIDQIRGASTPGPASPARVTLASGIRIGVVDHADGWADLRWTFPHHKPSASQLGVARLTARLLLDSPLRDATTPSLRRQIESLGGRIHADVNSFATAIDLRVPSDQWQTAMLVLTQALSTVPTATIRAERYAAEESRELTRQWLDDPLSGLITRIRTFERKPIADWVDAAESASLLQAQAFRGLEYTARGSVLVGRLPGGPSVLRPLADSVADFARRNPGSPRAPGPARLSPEGLFWSPARAPGGLSTEFSATTPPGYSEVAWAIDLLPLGAAGSEALRIATELLTLDGVGGRLQRVLDEQLAARIPLRAEEIHESDRSLLVLRGTVPTEAVLGLRDAINIAVRSILDDPAYPQEWTAAADRARLRFQAEITTRDGWLRAATATLRQPIPDNFEVRDDGSIRPVENQPLDPWAYGQAVIQRSSADQFTPLLEPVLSKVPLMIALGGEPIRIENVFPLQNALLSDRRLEVTIADDTERRRRADEQWQATLSKLGGGLRLAAIQGYESRCFVRSGRGPEIAEHSFARIDGRFRRIRRVLDTTITTVGFQQSGFDLVDDERTELAFDDLLGQRQELLRHPCVLAGRAARGEDRYRLVSVRQVRDRELLILERLEDDVQALRVWVDSESGLIRTVRSLESREEGQVWVREDYFDYRDTGTGVRAPFQRHASIDGNLRGLATEWIDIDFGQVTDADLKGGQ